MANKMLNSNSSRSVIHLDLDAFFAAVEQNDCPELRGHPVLVGGHRERGVVCACSYEARRYGIHSAMPMAQALRLCPAAKVLPVRMKRYRELSAQVFGIFSRFTDRIEPLSIDEAFLDVSGCERLFGQATIIASRIRKEVRAETGLTVSAGVAPNKFLAKLASDFGKPDGLVEVRPEAIDEFLLPLPLSRLHGVGEVTVGKLRKLGLLTVADLRQLRRSSLINMLGAQGEHLYRLARGEDDRPVETARAIKSVGHEETFSSDLWNMNDLHKELLDLCERVAARLRRHGLTGRCITLKVKYSDFVTVTRGRTIDTGMDNAMMMYREGLSLLEKTEAGRRPVRLLGISLSLLEEEGSRQADLFEEETRLRLSALDRAVDGIRERFGAYGVRRGALVELSRSGDEEGGDTGQ
jgi:DNA polymerase-4